MYDEVDINSLQTGDLILFSGRGPVPLLIKTLTLSKWSHCGVIIADDPNHPYPLLYESTHNNKLVGLDLGTTNCGVQLVALKERLEIYDGDVAVRRIIHPDYRYRQALRDYRTLVKGAPFETDRIQILAASRFFSFLRKGRDLKGIFCSEHVAEVYQALGWMRKDIPSNWFSPRYFSKVEHFLHGVQLGSIQYLKRK